MQKFKSPGDILGRMKQPISFIRLNEQRNQPTASSSPETIVYSCHASIEKKPIGAASERESGAVTIAVNRKIFMIRYIALVDDETLILRHRGHDYDIEGVDDIYGDRVYMEIIATRRK